MYYVKRGAKCLVAAVVVGLSAWWKFHENGMTADEWGELIALAVPAGIAVWAVPNAAKKTITES